MRSAVLKLIVLSLSLLAATASQAQIDAAHTPGHLRATWGANDRGPAADDQPGWESGTLTSMIGRRSLSPSLRLGRQCHSTANAVHLPNRRCQTGATIAARDRCRPYIRRCSTISPARRGGFCNPIPAMSYQRVIADPNSVLAADASLTQGIDLARPDGNSRADWSAGDHTLHAGQMLFSVRYDQESFDDNFVSSHRVSTASVLAAFPFAPRRLFQNRETALFEYGATEDFTLPDDAAVPTLAARLFGCRRRIFEHFVLPTLATSRSPGLYVLYRRPGQQLHLNFGLSAPTGFLDSQTDQPSPTFPNLPYVIRTSSGSYDLLPGLTYRGQNEFWTWGVQATGDVHLGLNRASYELGDQADVTAWLSRRLTQRWGASARIDGQSWGNVRGADPRLNTNLSPTNRPDMQGGSRLNLLFGINYFLPAERTPGQQFSIEVGVPLFQSLDGPQLGLDWTLITGWNLLW